jgi:hypothetical protein
MPAAIASGSLDVQRSGPAASAPALNLDGARRTFSTGEEVHILHILVFMHLVTT